MRSHRNYEPFDLHFILGDGIPLFFPTQGEPKSLILQGTKTFDSGLIQVSYARSPLQGDRATVALPLALVDFSVIQCDSQFSLHQGQIVQRSPMNQKQREKWAKIRSMGKYRYLLIYGVILWGIPVALIYAVFSTLIDNNFSLQRLLALPILKQLFVAKLFISMILFPICGIIVAWWLWEYYESKYLDE